jgi:hypothetical protein
VDSATPLRRVGPHPVGPGLSTLPGADASLDPPGVALVVPAADLVRAGRLADAAEAGRDGERVWVAATRAAGAARREADLHRDERDGWLREAERMERRAAAATDPLLAAVLALAAHRAAAALDGSAGRPLVVLGDHPDLGERLDEALDRHPQVVHLPEA